jgi:hypothetical protein
MRRIVALWSLLGVPPVLLLRHPRSRPLGKCRASKHLDSPDAATASSKPMFRLEQTRHLERGTIPYLPLLGRLERLLPLAVLVPSVR